MSEIYVPDSAALVPLTAEIVSAYVANNHVPDRDLPALIAIIHGSLMGAAYGAPAASAEPEVERPSPAQIRKSITPDALISFIDGKGYKTLKRHLAKSGLDPHSYRVLYGLPGDYPMTAPGYSARRSELARSMGLGRKGEEAAEAEPAKKAARRQTTQAAA